MRVKIIAVLLLISLALTGNAQIKEFNLTVDPADFQYIYDNYEQDNYVPATFSYNGTTWADVSIRIRGDGSRVYPKKSLKIRFNQGEYIDGRVSLNLNAEWEDQTYIQQSLASILMQASGQVCFKTEHVRLSLNGNFLGLYLLIEAVDEHFLAARGMNTLGYTYKAALDASSLSVFDVPA
ncbi:MAG: CotH kinase family protein [Flavobacteriales bacterium]|nr:CotH kinase family protein [Flavobacteriales bacterium]